MNTLSMYDHLYEEVRSVARAVARSWSDVVEADDLEQEIWVKLLESSPENLEEICSMDKPRRRTLLNSIGNRIANGERDAFDIFSGNFYYGTEDVRGMLEDGDLDNTDLGMSIYFDPDNVSDSHDPSDSLAERSDLQMGMEELKGRNSSYFAAIVNRYVHDIPAVSDSERKLIQRAVDALSQEMNGSRRNARARWMSLGGPGNRKVVSNARASAQTSYEINRGLQ